MYSKYEKPMITASIFYYDYNYESTTAIRVLDILEAHGFFPPEKINADKLTKNRFKPYDENTKNIFIRSYSEKDVYCVNMASGNMACVEEFWQFLWSYTFYKDSKLKGTYSFKPWNVLTLQSTYGRLKSTENYNNFISCFKAIIQEINPFCAVIDDLANKVHLLEQTGEQHFVADHIQQIYWGNYFGKEYCRSLDIEHLSLPCKNMEKIGEGIFFTLTDNVFDYDSPNCKTNRKSIRKLLNIKNYS